MLGHTPLTISFLTPLLFAKKKVNVSTDRALAVEANGVTWRFDIVLTNNLLPDVGRRTTQPDANIHDPQRKLQKEDPNLRLTTIYPSQVFNVAVPMALRGQNFIGDIGGGRCSISARLLHGGADVLVKVSSAGGRLWLNAQKRQDRH